MERGFKKKKFRKIESEGGRQSLLRWFYGLITMKESPSVNLQDSCD